MSIGTSQSDLPRLWHPFAAMPAAARSSLVLMRGEGVRLWDVEGGEYLDAMASLWYCNVGHGREELADVAWAQTARLAGFHTFDGFANEPALALAERLTELAPLPEPSAAFLVSGGSDAVDTAAKIARRYWQVRGEPQRTVIVSRGGAYHGMHAYGTSLAGIEANGAGWGTIVPDTRLVPMHDAAALERLLIDEGGRIAAFIGEPVIGAGGVHPPGDGYWEAVRTLCRDHEVLLIADEVITGYGRLGTWFGAERFGIEPDLITTAKGLSSGYAPIGAVLAGPRVLDVLWGDDAPMFRHGYTYSGHPVACAVALANLEIIDREGLRERVREREPELAAGLAALADHPLVGSVRSCGLLGAVELRDELLGARLGLVDAVVRAARRRGLLTRGLVGRSLQLSPPFTTSSAELGEMLERLRQALDDVEHVAVADEVASEAAR